MAYAAMISLSQILEPILHSNQPQPQTLLEDQQIIVRSLNEKLGLLLSFLENSPPKNRESATYLEGRIRDATNEAQDIILFHMSKQIPSASASDHHGVSDSQEKCEQGLHKVIGRLSSILEEVDKMKDADDTGGPQPINTGIDDRQPRNLLPPSASTNVDALVGLDDDLRQIKERLIGQPSDRLRIIPVVGMGGIGKSTLTRNIYNDSIIMQHFDIRAWTTVSQNYHFRQLLISLVDSATNCRFELKQLNDLDTTDLATLLHQNLKGKRYLIVIDDIWDTDAWDKLYWRLPDDNIGSRIILTTRESSVAVDVSKYSSPIHQMNFLSLKTSWDLLRLKVFGEEYCPPELEEIGKVIAERCKGLPLAIVVIGGVLYKSEKTQAYWHYVAQNIVSVLNRNYEDFMEILSCSYDHLPHHLRACFLYMGAFPEDYVIHVSNLIRLWVAQGFLKPVVPKSLEQVGKEYVADLIDRNLIMVHDRSCLGGVKTCNIHDLMRDLCIRKAQEEKLLYVTNHASNIPLEILKNCRGLSIHRQTHFDFADMHDSTLQSFLYFGERTSLIRISFQVLTSLDACHITFDEFPVGVVELVNLKYLALVYNGTAPVPSSIVKLHNLQTLIIFQRPLLMFRHMIFLPSEIWEMRQLRHLLFGYAILPPLPSGAQNGNLQTISGVYNFSCTKESYPNLKKLRITCVYDPRKPSRLSDCGLEDLAHLHQLEILKFKVADIILRQNIREPENIAFPPNLKKITLWNYKISWEKMSIIGSLSNLEALKLKGCAFEGNTWKTNEGEFQMLKLLFLENNLDLVHLETEDTHFPRLECLVLDHCPNLECIPSQIGEILTLQQIILVGCQSSVEASAKSIQEEQHDSGNEDFQLHIYPYFHKYGVSFRQMYASRTTQDLEPVTLRRAFRKLRLKNGLIMD